MLYYYLTKILLEMKVTKARYLYCLIFFMSKNTCSRQPLILSSLNWILLDCDSCLYSKRRVAIVSSLTGSLSHCVPGFKLIQEAIRALQSLCLKWGWNYCAVTVLEERGLRACTAHPITNLSWFTLDFLI